MKKVQRASLHRLAGNTSTHQDAVSGGLFVAGSTGFVGVNVLSKIREQLHVNGQLQTDKLIAGNTDKGTYS